MVERPESFGAIRPTLFLGLGGTGKEVLLRLRRKFCERFGEPSLPCTAFIYLDTDMQDVMAQGERVDELYRPVFFMADERIPLLDSGLSEVMSSIFRDRSHWEHVHKWLHEEMGNEPWEIDANFLFAGIRPVGRLLFFLRYPTIRERVSQALCSLTTQETIDQSRRFLGGAEWLPEPKEWEGIFDDLIVYSDEEAKAVKEALEVLLFGSILRVIEVKDVNGRLEYSYKKWIPPAPRLEILGTRREAIEILRGDSMFRGSLLKTLKEREDGLKDQLESYYWLLSYLSLSEEFPPKTPERILLEDTLFRIHDRLAKDKDKAELSLEHLPQEKQVEEAKARLGDNAEWIGTFPVLKGLEAWVSRD
jgi:hypothetical protein